MFDCRLLTGMLCLAFVVSVRDNALAKGRCEILAATGQAAHVSANWPEGVGELVNDASRTFGWTSWFPDMPNDVNDYALEIESNEDLNRLIEKLAAIKCDLRQIRLSPLGEPGVLDGAARFRERNGIPVIFSIGDQVRVDEWFKGEREPLFGGVEFTATPVAIPPTLTIFVKNRAITLDELRIPEGIQVLLGDVPFLFHRFNMTRGTRKVESSPPVAWERPSASSRAAMKQIEAFLESRESSTKR